MKRIRNRLPSVESQKPSTVTGSLPSWAKCPSTEASVNGLATSGTLTRMTKSAKSYVEVAGNVNMNTSNVAGAAPQNTLFAQGSMMKVRREAKDLLVSMGPGAMVQMDSNYLNTAGDSRMIISLGYIVDVEYFVKGLPISIGADVSAGITMTTTSIGGASTTVMNVTTAQTGFNNAFNIAASTLRLRVYFK